MKGWMFEGGATHNANRTAEQILDRFRGRVDAFENVFGQLFQTDRLKRLRVADDYGFSHVHDDLLRFLRRCVSGEDHPFALPDIPCYLNELLACEDFYGGIEPRIGRKHMRVIAIDGFLLRLLGEQGDGIRAKMRRQKSLKLAVRSEVGRAYAAMRRGCAMTKLRSGARKRSIPLWCSRSIAASATKNYGNSNGVVSISRRPTLWSEIQRPMQEAAERSH
jgi:hypothetical protein